jgi:hypothetical protein
MAPKSLVHKSTDEVRETTEDLSAILSMLQSLQKDMELMKLDNKELKELITSQHIGEGSLVYTRHLHHQKANNLKQKADSAFLSVQANWDKRKSCL